MRNRISLLFIKEQVLCLLWILQTLFILHVLSRPQIIIIRLHLKDFFPDLQFSTRTRDRHGLVKLPPLFTLIVDRVSIFGAGLKAI